MFFVQYYYDGSTISSDVMVPQLAEMGFTYVGLAIFPESPEDKFFLYLSEDGKVEAQRVVWGDGGWAISFQLTDPEDFKHIIPE